MTPNPHARRPLQLRGIVIKPGRMADGQQHPAIVAVMPRPQTVREGNRALHCERCNLDTLTPDGNAVCPRCQGALTVKIEPEDLDMSNEAMYAGAPDVARDADRKAGLL